MATGWESDLRYDTVKVYGVKDFPKLPNYLYPYLYIDWPDLGIIHINVLDAVVDLATKRMEQGEQIEVGCLGGHGRTGTLLACILGAVENLGVTEAVGKIRKLYCPQAVESSSQIELIAAYLGTSGAPLPAPAKLSYSQQNVETFQNHYYGGMY